MTAHLEETFPSYRAKQATIDAAWELCEMRFSTLPKPLHDLATAFLQSIASSLGTHRSYFSTPFAPPLLYMPLWLSDGLSRAPNTTVTIPQQTLVHVLAATMQGYIAIRIQDDVLDEPLRANPSLLLLGNTCFSYMNTELTLAVGKAAPRFWSATDRALVDFSHLTLVERDAVFLDNPYTIEQFDIHADKVAFARIPLLAIAAIAERWDLEPGINELVHQLGIAYGIANDVLGWPRDVRSGHRTWLLGEAGFSRNDWERLQALPKGPEHDAASAEFIENLRKNLYEGGLLRSAIKRAIEVHRQTEETARTMSLVGFQAFTDERNAWLETLIQQTSLLTLQRLLRGQRG